MISSFKRGVAALAVTLLALAGVAVVSPAVASAGSTISIANAMKGNPAALQAKATSNSRGLLAGPYWHYAYGIQNHAAGTVDGAAGYMLVGNPFLDTKDAHSLGEISVSDAAGNTVEVGWTKDPIVCGTNGSGVAKVCVFVYWWNAGVKQCYNTSCSGFVEYTTNCSVAGAVCAGDEITGTPVSRYFDIERTSNAWWVGFNGQYIGYFPTSLFTGGFASSTKNQYFGEVATKTTGYGPSGTSCSDMGTGVLGNAVGRATISTTSYHVIGGAWTASTLSMGVSTTTGLAIPAGAWNVTPYVSSVRSFGYGGGMWNSTGTAAGTTGFC
jgi:hypothetical protein